MLFSNLVAIQDFSDQNHGKLVQNCSSLQRLKLNSKKFSATVSNCLKHCRNLQELYLSSKQMDAVDLVHTLSQFCQYLSVLDLSNSITLAVTVSTH